MPTFAYRAIDRTGKPVSGTLDAADRKQVINKLRATGLQPVEIKARGVSGEKDEGGVAVAQAGALDVKRAPKPEPVRGKRPAYGAAAQRASGEGSRFRFKSDGEKLALGFLRKVHQLHSSGLALGDSIKILNQRVSDPRLQELAHSVWRDLTEGHTLAAAMRQYPKIFDPALIHLIEAGESTGNLVPILGNVITHLEQRADLRRKIVGGLSYPIFLVLMAFGVIGIFLFFLLPRIQEMMKSMGGKMSLPAQLLIGLSEVAFKQGPFLILGLIVAVIVFFQWRKTPNGRLRSDGWLLRLPLLGGIFSNADICRVANLHATLLGSGVNTTETMRLSERAIRNVVLQARFQSARILVNDGASFAVAFRRNRVLPDTDLDILSVGENTGNLVRSFQEIHRTHSKEMEDQLKRMTVLLSTGALIFAFTLVGVLAAGIVLSILQLSQSLMHR